MDKKEKAKELLDEYGKLTGWHVNGLNGWIVKELAVNGVEKIIKELKSVEFNYGLEESFKENSLTPTVIKYWEEVVEELNNYKKNNIGKGNKN